MSLPLVYQLWDRLWQDYCRRVPYAALYAQMIAEAGGQVANDHIAFRSLRLTVNGVDLGIAYLGDLVTTLGYQVAGEYHFPDQHLYAQHFCHPAQEVLGLPKLFISELRVAELSADLADLIRETVQDVPPRPSLDLVGRSRAEDLAALFCRPWRPPLRSTVERVNTISQYGAWVLLHGYAPNHFTAYINHQHTDLYPDIEHMARALADRGVPMKAEIEGAPGSGLRQTATQAVQERVTVREADGSLAQIPWTYAYYELAERNWVTDAAGQRVWFDGFLGAQAQHLFEMTRPPKSGNQ